MHFEKICRICLGEGIMSSIFEIEDHIGNSSIPCTEMLLACATVTVSEKDGLPSQICVKCHKQLSSAYKFRKLCENSFKIMLDYVANIIKDNEIKLEKEETSLFDSNLFEIKLSDKDIKDEDDSIKVEEFDDMDDERASSFDEGLDIPKVKLDSNKTLRGIAHEKRKLKRAKKKNMKLKIKRPTAEKSEKLTCSLCPRTFKWRYLLISHQDSHIGIKRYFCELCGKSYRSEKDHRNMHRRGNTFKCEVCDKCFNTKAKQVIHVATHSSDRERIVCSVEGCNKTFLSLGGLDRHRFSHTGLKNFICHLCSKSFIDKYQLEIHIRSHTNERPFPCSVCSKTFITSSARISHERWHTNTKNYHCDYCDKSFVCSSGRKRHLLIHSKEQLQSCRFCSKKFSRYDNKKRHEMAMHGISDDKTSQIV